MGDLAGFAAACYMRGVDFYNIPTTALAQIDSSIGGKVAINFEGVKNVVGAFYQPRRVLIDPALLDTLPPRQFANGMAEALKAGMVGDEPCWRCWSGAGRGIILRRFFCARCASSSGSWSWMKRSRARASCSTSATPSPRHRERLRPGGPAARRVRGPGDAAHVHLPALRARLEAALQKNGLPTRAAFDPAAVYAELCHDKKAAAGRVTIVTAARAGGAAGDRAAGASAGAAGAGGKGGDRRMKSTFGNSLTMSLFGESTARASASCWTALPPASRWTWRTSGCGWRSGAGRRRSPPPAGRRTNSSCSAAFLRGTPPVRLWPS